RSIGQTTRVRGGDRGAGNRQAVRRDVHDDRAGETLCIGCPWCDEQRARRSENGSGEPRRRTQSQRDPKKIRHVGLYGSYVALPVRGITNNDARDATTATRQRGCRLRQNGRRNRPATALGPRACTPQRNVAALCRASLELFANPSPFCEILPLVA